MSSINFLESLESIISERAKQPAASSYTADLLHSGTRRIAQKVGEEAVELALAATAGDREEQLDEAADLLYHLLVLLSSLDLQLADAVQVLEARHQAA
ncbi:MAG: phosphoribosyl-ATP diphosphatase [Woeseia sp.]